MDCAAKGRVETPCTGPATRRCGLCGAVAYCSPAHQSSHWSDHKEECARLEKQMRSAEAFQDFPFTFSADTTVQVTQCSFLTSRGLHGLGFWKYECHCNPSVAASDCPRENNDWGLPSALCPCTEPVNPISTCLNTWRDYYQWRSLPLNSPVALLLHWPLTIYQGVQLAPGKNLISEVSGELNIHYLGPENEIFQLPVFGELHALFPHVQVHIELVGPKVPQSRDGERINLYSYAHCVDIDCPCKSAGQDASCVASNERKPLVTLHLRKGFYHELSGEMDYFPHLLVGLNAGIAAYPSWSPTIEMIQKMGVPAIFSDYCEEAAHLAAGCITSVTGNPLTVPVQLNPFRRPIAVENSALCLPCNSNCFLFGM